LTATSPSNAAVQIDPELINGPVCVIVGPTAVGKSALALDLAERFKRRGQAVEIISADSRQIYRGLDIGTAKPTLAEQAAVRHHLIDLVEPEEDFSVAEFQDRAYAAIREVHQHGGLPLVVGGTGLYVRAIVEGLQLPRVPADTELRHNLEGVATLHGPLALHQRLAALDPVAAARIDPRNIRRVIRAIEVTLRSGRPFSESATSRPLTNVLRVGLTLEREALYRQIDERVDRQMAAGLVDETRAVLDRGCSPNRPALTGFGYRQVVGYLAGELDIDTAVQQYKYETHRFARQQYAWFRLDDPAIAWFNVSPAVGNDVLPLIEEFSGRSQAKPIGAATKINAGRQS
jgi:tRNA dimethylallyltransferase